jgi:SSS family solute:Na+ symporter
MLASINIATIDLVIIVTYMLVITTLGVWLTRRKRMTGEIYFLAGRSLRWPVIGAALFASNISTIHFVGLAEAGYKYGLVIGNFEWMATFTLMLLALVFAPFYFKSHISTLPEFLEKRYCPSTRSILACMAILSALLIHIGISLFAGAVVFKTFFGIDIVTSILIIATVTGLYTALGGLKAVVFTETVGTFVLLTGAITVTLMGIFALPSVGVHSLADFKAAVKPDQLSMLQASNKDGFAWYAIFLGYPILGIWYWCTDQTIVQRVLGARTQLDAQHGALFAGVLKILPVFFLVLPGVLGYVLYKQQIGDKALQTFPFMVNSLIPVGLKGIVAAALVAALMSSIGGALNSVGTLVAIDLVKHFRPQTTDAGQVRIGAFSSVVVMILATVWSTQGGKFGSIFEAINKMPAQFLAPPITTVFVWGVFWRRGTKQAALTTLIVGFIYGIVAFVIDLPVFGDTQWISDPKKGLGISFMMQAWWNFCICSVIYVITSLLTPKPDPAQVDSLTWGNPLKVIFHGKLAGAGDPRLVAAVIFVGMVVLYSIFH